MIANQGTQLGVLFTDFLGHRPDLAVECDDSGNPRVMYQRYWKKLRDLPSTLEYLKLASSAKSRPICAVPSRRGSSWLAPS